jgi:hypothetical protein
MFLVFATFTFVQVDLLCFLRGIGDLLGLLRHKTWNLDIFSNFCESCMPEFKVRAKSC